ncbi:MAG: hypothetical protein VX313_06155 [Bacteroidota bacterium]|nr:hypothetical protein [Bacteroidota bacterium]MEC7659623.1 hypothetical protein [Bacteroidota bacterium]MEE3020815.1 hypothetical protein [Bacteroidota bacterium]
MRRRFNQDLLPKHPPKPHTTYGKNTGSKFNRWFRDKLKEHNLQILQFAELAECNYATVIGWRYRNDPQCYGRVRVAKVFSDLENSDYDTMLKEVKKLCGKR